MAQLSLLQPDVARTWKTTVTYMHAGFAHEFKNLEWNADLPMSLRTWNGVGIFP